MSKVNDLEFLLKLVKFLDGTKGKDKFLKIIQYTSRFLKWYILVHNPKSVWGPKFDGLSSTTSNGRKLWRLGKSLNEYTGIQQLLYKHARFQQQQKKKHEDGYGDEEKENENKREKSGVGESWSHHNFIFYMTFTAKFTFLLYWFLDNVGFLIRAKVVNYDRKKMTRMASYPWFVGCVAYFMLAVYHYSNYQRERSDGSLIRLREDVCRYFCDVMISYSSAEFPYGSTHDGVLGVVGALSALIGAKQIWEDTK